MILVGQTGVIKGSEDARRGGHSDARVVVGPSVEPFAAVTGITDIGLLNHIMGEWRQLMSLTWTVSVTTRRGNVPDGLLFGVAGRPELREKMLECEQRYTTPHLLEVLKAHPELCISDPDSQREKFEADVRRGLHIHFPAILISPHTDSGENQKSRVRVGRSFLRTYGGIPVRTISTDAVNVEAAAAAQLNGFRVWKLLPAPAGSTFQHRLVGVTRESSIWCGNHLMEELFSAGPVQVPMGSSLRRVVYWASVGLEDPAIAERIFVAPGSMKTYWDRVFDAFHARWPGFFETGRTKKSQVLAYVGDHPEERWPVSELD